MLNKLQDRINGESFREVNRRRRSRRGIRENFHRLSGTVWIGMTMVASLCSAIRVWPGKRTAVWNKSLFPEQATKIDRILSFCIDPTKFSRGSTGFSLK